MMRFGCGVLFVMYFISKPVSTMDLVSIVCLCLSIQMLCSMSRSCVAVEVQITVEW